MSVEMSVDQEIIQFANKIEEAQKQRQALLKGLGVAYSPSPYASTLLDRSTREIIDALDLGIWKLHHDLSQEAKELLNDRRYILLPKSRIGIWARERRCKETGALDGPHMIVVRAWRDLLPVLHKK